MKVTSISADIVCIAILGFNMATLNFSVLETIKAVLLFLWFIFTIFWNGIAWKHERDIAVLANSIVDIIRYTVGTSELKI